MAKFLNQGDGDYYYAEKYECNICESTILIVKSELKFLSYCPCCGKEIEKGE